MTDDAELLRRYVEKNSEAAFAEFVHRHIGLVFSSALRRTGGNAHAAGDIAQQVFIQAARHARPLARHPRLTGWLYAATRNAALNFMRDEQRRQRREREAGAVAAAGVDTAGATEWERLRPVLDAALDELGEQDREAVLLRFFGRHGFAEIGRRLRLSENAARMRVERALEKLQTRLVRRGVTSTAVALGAVFAQEAIAVAPPGLAGSVTGAAIAGAATAGTGAGSLGVFSLMSTSKFVATIAVLAAAAGIGIALYQARETGRAREATAAVGRERDALQTRLTALEQRMQISLQNAAAAAERMAALEKELAAAREKSSPARPEAATAVIARAPLDNAKVQEEKARLHRRYDSFLQQRGLTPAQTERFIDLMFEKNRVREDVQAAVEQMNADGHHPDVQALRSRLDGPLWAEMASLLGPGGMEAFGEHEESSALRIGFIDPMREQFRRAGADLTPQQEDQLVRILRANRSSRRGKSTDLGSVPIFGWEEVVAQAAAVLSPAQRPVFGAEVARWRASGR